MKVATLLSIVLMAVGATANALPKGLIARDCEEDDCMLSCYSKTGKRTGTCNEDTGKCDC
ncbi:hypothetical protein WAI453_013239 [Rhynchosporium graminicola]